MTKAQILALPIVVRSGSGRVYLTVGQDGHAAEIVRLPKRRGASYETTIGDILAAYEIAAEDDAPEVVPGDPDVITITPAPADPAE